MEKKTWFKILSVITLIFGIVTVFKGGSVLFSDNAREQAGIIVPIVLWYNFIAGFFYILAAIAIFRQKACALKLVSAIAITSLLTLAYLLAHIAMGGPYETRTLVAMSLRSGYWLAMMVVIRKMSPPKSCDCSH